MESRKVLRWVVKKRQVLDNQGGLEKRCPGSLRDREHLTLTWYTWYLSRHCKIGSCCTQACQFGQIIVVDNAACAYYQVLCCGTPSNVSGPSMFSRLQHRHFQHYWTRARLFKLRLGRTGQGHNVRFKRLHYPSICGFCGRVVDT